MLRRVAHMAEFFLFIRRGGRDAGGLHREGHLPRFCPTGSTSTSFSSFGEASLVGMAVLLEMFVVGSVGSRAVAVVATSRCTSAAT